jgi:hypothetical protein
MSNTPHTMQPLTLLPEETTSKLRGIGLNREEHNLFTRHLRHMLDEPVPYLGVNSGVFDRRIRKNDRARSFMSLCKID